MTSTAPTTEPAADLTVPMAARELGVSKQTALGYAWRGLLEARRVGRYWVVSREALDRFKRAHPELRPAA